MTAPLSVVALSAQLHPNSESHAFAGKTDGECGRESMICHHRATHKSHIRAQFRELFQGTFGRNFKGLSRAWIFVVHLLFVTKFLTLLSCFPVVSNQCQSDRGVYWCDVTTFVVCWLMFVMAVVISSWFDKLSWFHRNATILLACGLGCCFEPPGVWPWQWKMMISVCLTSSGCSVIRPAGSEGVTTHRESQWP